MQMEQLLERLLSSKKHFILIVKIAFMFINNIFQCLKIIIAFMVFNSWMDNFYYGRDYKLIGKKDND